MFAPINMEPLRGHWTRVAHVHVQVCGSDDLTQFHGILHSTTMHNLQNLRISFKPVGEETEYLLSQLRLPAVPHTMLPVLHTLDLPFFCLPSFSVKSLRDLSICSFADPHYSPQNGVNFLPEMYDVLARCPDLENLHMGAPLSAPFEALHNRRTVNLPRLRRLSLYQSGRLCMYFEHLLQTLRIPATACVTFYAHHWPLTTVAALLKLHPPAADRVVLNLNRDDEYTLSCYAHCGTLCLNAILDTLDARALGVLFARTGVATLECIVAPYSKDAFDEFDAFDWRALFFAAPGVVRLELCGVPVEFPFQALTGLSEDENEPTDTDAQPGAAPPVP